MTTFSTTTSGFLRCGRLDSTPLGFKRGVGVLAVAIVGAACYCSIAQQSLSDAQKKRWTKQKAEK